jgi:hypothetical protein
MNMLTSRETYIYTLEYYTHKYILSRGVNNSLQEAAAPPIELVAHAYAVCFAVGRPSAFQL